MWIPSHVGIRGNEWVDRLVKEALSLDRVILEFLIVLGVCSHLWTEYLWGSGSKDGIVVTRVDCFIRFNQRFLKSQSSLLKTRVSKQH